MLKGRKNRGQGTGKGGRGQSRKYAILGGRNQFALLLSHALSMVPTTIEAT